VWGQAGLRSGKSPVNSQCSSKKAPLFAWGTPIPCNKENVIGAKLNFSIKSCYKNFQISSPARKNRIQAPLQVVDSILNLFYSSVLTVSAPNKTTPSIGSCSPAPKAGSKGLSDWCAVFWACAIARTWLFRWLIERRKVSASCSPALSLRLRNFLPSPSLHTQYFPYLSYFLIISSKPAEMQ